MSTTTLRWQAFFWVNVSCLCWAGNLAVGRLLRDQIGPALLVGLRTALAAILFAALMYALRSRGQSIARAHAPRQWGLLLLMAGTGIVGYQILLYGALQTTGAFNAALINACAPLVTAVLSWAVYGSRLSPGACAGVALSVAGVAAILSAGELDRLLALRFGRGDLLVLLAVFLWAVYSLAGRRVMQQRSVVATTAAATVLALPLSIPWIVIEGAWESVEWTGGVIGGVVYVAVFASVVAMLAWNRAVALAGPTTAAAAMNMMPLYALLSSLALNESLHAAQAVGGAMIIAGCLWATLAPASAN